MSFQPDEPALRLQGKPVEFSQVIRSLRAKEQPPRLRNTPYIVSFDMLPGGANDTRLLVPANPDRMGITFGLSTLKTADLDTLFFSYGYPIKFTLVPGVSSFGIPFLGGMALGIDSVFAPGNGSVSIDDIYVTCVGDNTHPLTVICYESVLAIEGKNAA